MTWGHILLLLVYEVSITLLSERELPLLQEPLQQRELTQRQVLLLRVQLPVRECSLLQR